MLDHIFLPVTDVARSVAFYEKALAPIGLSSRVDYDGKDGPPGHPDLKGFGKDGRLSFWLREGRVEGERFHVGFVAASRGEVDAAYKAAIEGGASDNGAPAIRPYYDTRYYAANVFDPDGHSIEFVYKSWQHPQR
jgi:catechol 2,3-dioxygenase-like lactoylglutathione lyase family enzyme